MKCQNCGNNEVNFCYSTIINGSVTEAMLCSDCAKKLGYLNDEMFTFSMSSFIGMMSDFFGGDGFFSRPGFTSGLAMSAFPQWALPGYAAPVPRYQQVAPQKNAASTQGAGIEVDDDIKRRRELNMLRERMKQATEAEDFEQAAQIRDEIKKFEDVE